MTPNPPDEASQSGTAAVPVPARLKLRTPEDILHRSARGNWSPCGCVEVALRKAWSSRVGRPREPLRRSPATDCITSPKLWHTAQRLATAEWVVAPATPPSAMAQHLGRQNKLRCGSAAANLRFC
eukprot:10282030-Alexandrium_andersonii.AAC.1